MVAVLAVVAAVVVTVRDPVLAAATAAVVELVSPDTSEVTTVEASSASTRCFASAVAAALVVLTGDEPADEVYGSPGKLLPLLCLYVRDGQIVRESDG